MPYELTLVGAHHKTAGPRVEGRCARGGSPPANVGIGLVMDALAQTAVTRSLAAK